MSNEQQHELIPMDLGDLLRQTRIERRLSLQDIGQAIRVKPETLAALESGETSHIPSVYLKGYIRNYARHLGLPPDAIEPRMEAAHGSEPVVQTIFKEGLPRNAGDRWFKASSYFVASAVVIALVWQFTNEAVRFSQGDPLLRPAQLENKTTAGSEKASPGDSASTAITEIPARTHLRASIASMNIGSDQTVAERPQVAEDAWAAIGNRDASVSSKDSTPLESRLLEIVTSADSWVEIIDRDGKRIEMDLLRAGTRRTYGAPEPLHLLLGRASSVEVIHNGHKIDLAPYTRGNVARLTLGESADIPQGGDSPGSESATTDLIPADQG